MTYKMLPVIRLALRKFALPGIVMALGGAGVVSAFAQTPSLSISLQPDRSIILAVQGTASRDYVLEATTNLAIQPWGLATLGFSDNSGLLQFTNQPLETGVPQFYRAVELPPLEPTTTTAAGLRDNEVLIVLGASDSSQIAVPFTATILALPSAGQLLQFDGTPITAAGTPVSDSLNRVRFVPATNAVGSPYGSFSYAVARTGGGLTAPQAVSLFIQAPLASTATTPRVKALEDTPLIFAFTANDPNPPPGGGALSFVVDFPPLQGRLYQVQPDNVTRGAVILSQSVIVANTNFFVMYVPPTNANGSGFETMTYRALTSRGGSSVPAILAVDVESVNDVPVALATNPTGDNDLEAFFFTLQKSDADNDALTVYFTQSPERGVFTIQNGPVVLGQPYNANDSIEYRKPDDGSYLGAYDYGPGYAHFSWYVKDPSGATSATIDSTINIAYVNTPPMPTAPGAVASASGNADVVLPLTSWDIDGDDCYIWVQSLPAHGSLYLRFTNSPDYKINGAGIVPGILSDSIHLIYRPDPTNNSTQPWTDSFTYFPTDDPWWEHGAALTFSIFLNITNSPPTLSGMPTLTATVNGSGQPLQPAKVMGFTIHDDSYIGSGTPAARQLQVTLHAVDPHIVSSDAGGKLSIDPSTATRFSSVLQTNDATLVLTGSESRFNQVFTGGNITYTPSVTNRAGYIQITVEDLGWSNSDPATPAPLSKTGYLPLSYQTVP